MDFTIEGFSTIFDGKRSSTNEHSIWGKFHWLKKVVFSTFSKKERTDSFWCNFLYNLNYVTLFLSSYFYLLLLLNLKYTQKCFKTMQKCKSKMVLLTLSSIACAYYLGYLKSICQVKCDFLRSIFKNFHNHIHIQGAEV